MALCSGSGALELGLELVVRDIRVVCHVEGEAFAAALLAQKMENGRMAPAPIWSDVRSFDGRPWRGKVDIVTAGFPCQPWSVAGKRKGTKDERWIWPDIARIICDVGPGIVLLENVRGFVKHGLAHVLGDLAGLGYDAEWDLFSAAQMGASHKRERVFILAYSENHSRWSGIQNQQEESEFGRCRSANRNAELAYAESMRRGKAECGESETERSEPHVETMANPQRRGLDPWRAEAGRQAGDTAGDRDEELEHPDKRGLQGGSARGAVVRDGRSTDMRSAIEKSNSQLAHSRSGELSQRQGEPGNDGPEFPAVAGSGGMLANPDEGELSNAGRGSERGGGIGQAGEDVADANGARKQQPERFDKEIRERFADIGPFPPGPDQFDEWRGILERYPALEPAVCGMAARNADRVDRLRMCGNGVVGIVAAAAFVVLMERFGVEIGGVE